MTALTNVLEVQLLDHVLRNIAFSSPSAVFVALFTADPGEGLMGGGAPFEVANANAYARQPVTFGVPVSGAGTSANTADVVFLTATPLAWGTITHVAIMTSATYGAGQGLFYGPLATPKVVGSGDVFRFIAGQLVAGLS